MPMKHHYQVTHITNEPFTNPHIMKIILNEVRYQQKRRGIKTVRICDPFARESWLTTKPQHIQGTTNDLNTDMPTDYHLEAKDFSQLMYDTGEEFDIILYDPPYNLSQLKRQYDGIGKKLELWQTLNPFGEARDLLAMCLRFGGSVISFGFGSRGFGKNRGCEKMPFTTLNHQEQRIDTTSNALLNGRYNPNLHLFPKAMSQLHDISLRFALLQFTILVS